MSQGERHEHEDIDDHIISSLEHVGYDCIWEVCLFLGDDYSTVAALATTCRTMYAYCNEEFIWRNIALLTLPAESFRTLDHKHLGLLTSARAEERRRFRVQRQAGLLGFDADETAQVGSGDVTDMTRYLPGYFRDHLRAHVLRSVTRNIQLFVEAAMSDTCDASTMLTQVKKREGDLRGYFATARDISFAQSCIGRSGAALLASSLSLCCGSDAGVCHLTKLDLTNQLIRDQGAESIIAALVGSRGVMHSLRTLLLGNNKMTDALAVWLGNLVFHSMSRGGALQELDISDNPNFSEEVIVQIASGMERAMFGGAKAMDMSTSLGLREVLQESEQHTSDHCAAWSRIAFRRLSLNGTHVGRRGVAMPEGNKKAKPIDWSAARGNTARGQSALCELLGCFTVIATATTSIARAEYDDALLRYRATKHRRDNSNIDAASFVVNARRCGAFVHVALRDCGFHHAIISACVEHFAAASAASAPPLVETKALGQLQQSAPACLFSADFSSSQHAGLTLDARSQASAGDATPNDRNAVSTVAAMLEQLSPDVRRSVSVLLTATAAPLLPSSELPVQQPKVVLGRQLAWEVLLPLPVDGDLTKRGKGDKGKGSGCIVM
jgi:hypothetical protein